MGHDGQWLCVGLAPGHLSIISLFPELEAEKLSPVEGMGSIHFPLPSMVRETWQVSECQTELEQTRKLLYPSAAWGLGIP